MATFGVASQGILSLADSVKSPLPVGHLVSMGMKGLWVHVTEDILNVRTLPEKQLETLQTIVVPAVMGHGYEQSLICERVFDLALFHASAKDIETKMTINSIHRAPEFWSATIALRKVLGLHDLDALSYINDMQKKIEAAALPPHEARFRFSVTGKTDHENLGPIARELVSSHFRVHRIVTRNLAKLQCARTALAVERYRLVGGRLPGTLDELVPDYLVGVPHDPFDGQQIRYRRLATGYVVYSIGQDLTDNQGEEMKTGEARELQQEWDETFTVER